MPGQLSQSIKPSGQGGDYTSIVTWEAQNLDLVSLDSSSYVEVSGDWTGLGPDGRFDLAGWTTDDTHQIYAKVTGEARHQGKYDPNKYVNTNLTYGNPINIGVDFATVDGFQAKLTGSNVAYFEGIQLNGSLNNCENIIKNCIVIDMHSGSGAAGNTGISFGYFVNNKKTGSLYNNIIIGFNQTHGNDSLVHTGIGNYGWPNVIVNNTMVDCYRPFYQNTGRTWIYNTIITGSTVGSYGTLTGSNNISNTDTFGINQVYGRVIFKDPNNYDYRLSPYDTTAIGNGLNLYSSSLGNITTDIVETSRGNISASYFDIGAHHSTQSIRTVKPSGQGGHYTSISSWESSEQINLVAVNKSTIAYIDGDWSGSMDSPLTIAGWVSDISNSISIIVTGSARHNGYYDETKYVILGTPYVNSVTVPSTELNAHCINIHGIQTKGPSSNYRRGINFDVYSNYHTIDSCIIAPPVTYGIQMNSGYTRVTNCTVINPDNYGIYIYGEDDWFFCCNNTIHNGLAGIVLWYSNNNPIYNNICLGQTTACFYNPGPYSTIGTKVGNNISSDGTAWGNNSFTSASVLFIDSSSYDFRLSPYDTTAIGNGINLYTASFGLPISCNVTHDVSGISRGNVSASYFDIGASHSTQSIKTIKPSSQGGDYSSLSSWESGEQTNLIAVNKSVVAQITGNWSGSVDSTSTVSITGWESDISHSITITCVGTGSRHNGVWDDTKYVIKSSGTDVITTYENEIHIDGLQLESTRTSTSANVIQVEDAGSSGRGFIYNCIGKMKSNTGNAVYFIRTGTGRSMYFKNNIAITSDYIASGTTGYYLQASNCYVYNCLSYNMGTGFRQQNNSGFAYNCIANACTSSGFLGTAWDGGHSNISNLGDAIGTNPINGDVNFINPSIYNFQLSPYDTVALGKGINVYTSSVSVTTDIADVSRGTVSASYFDIGPFHCTESIKTIKPSGQGGDYSSLPSWESGEQTNLVSINKTFIGEIGGTWSSPDSSCGFGGWITSENNWVKVRTTGDARHNGVWDTNKYWINGGTGASIGYSQNYVLVDGIQGYQTGSGNYFNGVVHFTSGDVNAISILENSILKVDSYSRIGSWTACIKGQFSNTGSYLVRNCIFTVGDSAYNSVSSSRVYCLYNYAKTTFYNCLAIRSKGYGFYEGGNYNMTYYNCIAQDTINGYVGGITAESDYNCSDLASDAPGANSVTADLTFQDTSSGNYRLTTADSAVIGTGLDLLSLGYDYAPTTDIVGNTRTSGSWDMGPFTFVSGPTPVPTVYVSARRMAGFFFP